MLRDINYANANLRLYQQRAGQWVQWFRFNPTGTTEDPIYDVGPQRQWYNAVTVPVLDAQYERAARNFDDDGLYLVDRAHLIISYSQFFSSAMPDPDPTGRDHLADRVALDQHLFAVVLFLPVGRIADQFLTIEVDLIEVAQEEMVEDVANPIFAPFIVAS